MKVYCIFLSPKGCYVAYVRFLAFSLKGTQYRSYLLITLREFLQSSNVLIGVPFNQNSISTAKITVQQVSCYHRQTVMKQLLGNQKSWINYENHCECSKSFLSVILHYTDLLLTNSGSLQCSVSETYFAIYFSENSSLLHRKQHMKAAVQS